MNQNADLIMNTNQWPVLLDYFSYRYGFLECYSWLLSKLNLDLTTRAMWFENMISELLVINVSDNAIVNGLFILIMLKPASNISF